MQSHHHSCSPGQNSIYGPLPHHKLKIESKNTSIPLLQFCFFSRPRARSFCYHTECPERLKIKSRGKRTMLENQILMYRPRKRKTVSPQTPVCKYSFFFWVRRWIADVMLQVHSLVLGFQLPRGELVRVSLCHSVKKSGDLRRRKLRTSRRVRRRCRRVFWRCGRALEMRAGGRKVRTAWTVHGTGWREASSWRGFVPSKIRRRWTVIWRGWGVAGRRRGVIR